MRGVTPLVLASVLLPAALGGQTQLSVAEHLALGDSAHAALAPAQALQHSRAAPATDSPNSQARGRAGPERVDIAKQTEGKDASPKRRRATLYRGARASGEPGGGVTPNGPSPSGRASL